MKILAIDTTESYCSVALQSDGERLGLIEDAPRRHTELVLPFAEQLLAEAGFSVNQLDAVAFARGPGSFTGIRVATGVAQGIALSADLPVVPVSSLRLLAQGLWEKHSVTEIIAAFDARMSEIYAGQFRANEKGLVVAVKEEVLCSPGQIASPGYEGYVLGGSAVSTYLDLLADKQGLESILDADAHCDAINLLPLAQLDFAEGLAVSAQFAQPTYLRNKVTHQR